MKLKSTSLKCALLILGVVVGGGLAFASDTIDIALRDVNKNLEPLGSYRQHHLVTQREGDTVTVQSEWSYTKLASGDETVEVSYPTFGQRTTDYLVGGEAYTLSQMGDEAMCFAMPEPNLTPLDMVIGDVSDLTGLHSATLVEQGVTVDDQLADHYRFDPPMRAGTNEGWTISGDIWLAQTGGYIVRYEVEADTGSGVTRWEYDAAPLDPTANISLPAACTEE